MEVSVNTLIEDLLWPSTEVIRTITAVAKGDLSQTIRLEVDGRPLEGGFLRSAKIVNKMVDQMSVFTSEVTRVAREVGTDGKLGGQAIVPGVAGTWKDLTDSVNAMATNLTGLVRNIAEVTTAVARGDLSRKITVDVKGEILELKNTINTMVAHSDGVDAGSESVVELPLREAQVLTPTPEVGAGSGVQERPGLRLLVVDDNADSVDALAMWLRIEGHRVDVAYSGEEALPLALTRRPEAVVLDLALPGIDGYEVARRLRRASGFASVCFIAMTGFGADADRERAREAGFNHHLVKPIDYGTFADLLARVRRLSETSLPDAFALASGPAVRATG
jgi:CheY-like chemotaxis protein/HAMP domain-containing protein